MRASKSFLTVLAVLLGLTLLPATSAVQVSTNELDANTQPAVKAGTENGSPGFYPDQSQSEKDSALEHLQTAAKVTRELAAKAENANGETLRQLKIRDIDTKSKVFPRESHIRELIAVRPWSERYIPRRRTRQMPATLGLLMLGGLALLRRRRSG